MSSSLPNLFVLGAAKSGTTTLADVLRQHPDIYMTSAEEPTFFSSDLNYSKGTNWYLEKFFHGASGYSYRGESSPSYLFFGRKVAPRMRADLEAGNLRLLVILRNPVDRAYSQYWHNVNRGWRETLTFEQALEAEAGRLQDHEQELNNLGRIRFAYFSAGLYVQQLRVFWNYFDRRQFLLLLAEDLVPHEFGKTLRSMHEFLGVHPQDTRHMRSNPSHRLMSRRVDGVIRGPSLAKTLLKATLPQRIRTRLKGSLLGWNRLRVSYPPMAPATRKMLQQRYAAEVGDLQEILERDLSSWLH